MEGKREISSSSLEHFGSKPLIELHVEVHGKKTLTLHEISWGGKISWQRSESNEIETHFRYDLSEGINVKFKLITALGA